MIERGLSGATYETLHERNGLKYQIVTDGVGLFGDPIIEACTFGEEMVPQMVRRRLGTFDNREAAEACLRAAIAAGDSYSRELPMDAYLEGVAAAGRPDALVCPYEEGTDEHDAWWRGVSDALDAIQSGE
jgi:hypothetical protein